MDTSLEKSSPRLSFEDQVKKHIKAEFIQGQLFGSNEMDQELLIEAYTRLEGKQRATALGFILSRDDCTEVLCKVLTRVANKILSGEKMKDIRLNELRDQVVELKSRELATLVHFINSSIANKKKRERVKK